MHKKDSHAQPTPIIVKRMLTFEVVQSIQEVGLPVLYIS